MNSDKKHLWPIIAALGIGVSLVGYCIYFDKKRRRAGNFNEKLRAKRTREKQREISVRNDIDIADPEVMRRFFLEKIQKGEDCLAQGDLDHGVDHLAKAVSLCSQPESLLQLFKQALPSEVFHELIIRLPEKRFSSQIIDAKDLINSQIQLD